MNSKTHILNNITRQGILPLFYHESAEVSTQTLRALYAGGIRVVEYTNRGANALENFCALKRLQHQEMADLDLGVGTIKNQQQAEAFAEAGADFLISPVVNAAVASVAGEAGLLWIPGCMTPTEINQAVELEAPLVKIFPANILGQEFIRSVKELFPGLLFMPTGGVELSYENMKSWFDSGVVAVGIGSKLITKDLLQRSNFDLLKEQTAKAMAIVGDCRNMTL